VRALCEARPELETAAARVRVHTAVGLINEMARIPTVLKRRNLHGELRLMAWAIFHS
jgi:hypothetical protein